MLFKICITFTGLAIILAGLQIALTLTHFLYPELGILGLLINR